VTDERDLLRAIPENPADDVVRLVYADWLEEHAGEAACPTCQGFGEFVRSGQGCHVCPGTGTVPDGRRERAEFIRVQCRIAEMEAAVAEQRKNAIMGGCCERFANNQACDCPSAPEVDALRKRERELWQSVKKSIATIPGGLWAFISDSVGERATDERVPFSQTAYGALVRRGFVESVRLPLAAFLGRPCMRCEGRGWHEDGYDRGVHVECNSCSGTGRLGGCAAELFASQPVLSVTLSDREPDGSDDGSSPPFAYYLDAPRLTYESRRSVLPAVLFDRLGGELSPHRSWRDFPTRAAALDALSAALVQWGRQLAGLTALPSPS